MKSALIGLVLLGVIVFFGVRRAEKPSSVLPTEKVVGHHEETAAPGTDPTPRSPPTPNTQIKWTQSDWYAYYVAKWEPGSREAISLHAEPQLFVRNYAGALSEYARSKKLSVDLLTDYEREQAIDAAFLNQLASDSYAIEQQLIAEGYAGNLQEEVARIKIERLKASIQHSVVRTQQLNDDYKKDLLKAKPKN